MEIEKRGSDVERIERFQSLQAGQYWRAKEVVGPEGIEKDEVLLLESIRWVDEAAHTIVMRAHPLKHGNTEYFEYEDEGGEKRRTRVSYGTHRFLLEDFLRKFEFEPDAQLVRQAELASVQAEVDGIKAEIVDFRNSPELVASIVEDGLENADREKAAHAGTNLPALSNEAAQAVASVATGSVANALSGGITENKIAVLKAAAEREHQIASIKSGWIAGKTKLIGETIKKMTPFYAEEAAAALAQTEDVRAYVAKLVNGIESLDLYIGKDVDVKTVRTGRSAPASVRLSLVQKKLCMDEELAVFLDVDQWFDFSRREKFFEALRERDDLVGQIFPTERCVLVMATTRRFINYGDGLTSAVRNHANHQVFMLVRDGENIHVVTSPIESHLATSRLFPSKGEGDRIFRGYDGRMINFDDLAFTDRLAVHESSALHYKRFLIMAAGLDHREKLFGDFYDENDAFEFVSAEFQDKYFNFIRDEDNSANLPREKREDVVSWIKKANEYVQSGSRVITNWRELIDEKTSPACFDQKRFGSNEPYQRYHPSKGYSVETVYREGTDLMLDVEVSGETQRGKDRTFNAKVNLTDYSNGRNSVEELGFLCLDKASPEELDWYIHNRGARANHILYIRMFKNALRHVSAERVDELRTREMMAQAMRDGKVVEEAAIPAAVNEAVAAWRAANRGKPLPRPQGNLPPQGWKSLLDLMFHSARGEGEMPAMAEAMLAGTGMEPLRLSVAGDGRVVLYASPAAGSRDDRIEPHIWVHRINLEFKDGQATERSRKWARLQAKDATEKLLKEWAGATEWFGLGGNWATPEAKSAALSAFTEIEKRIAMLSTKDEGVFEELFSAWKTVRDDINGKAKYVQNVSLYLPIGIAKDRYGEAVTFALCIDKAHEALAAIAPDEAAQTRLLDKFVSIYGKPERGAELFRQALAAPREWRIVTISSDLKVKPFMMLEENSDYGDIRSDRRVDPLMAPAFKQWRERKESGSWWFADGILDGDGSFRIDEILGLRRPEGYGPYHMFEVTVSDGDGKDVEFGRFTDISMDRSRRMGSDAAPEAFKGGDFRFGGYSFTVATMADAEARVAKRAEEAGLVARRASEMPDGLDAGEGVDRWFFVKP